MVKLNFADHPAAQDMIKIIERDKHFSASAAIAFAVNLENKQSIIDAGWAEIALSLWGHAEPEREWDKLDDPCIDVELSDEKIKLIESISKKYRVNTEIAVSFFLIFTMDSLGYHI